MNELLLLLSSALRGASFDEEAKKAESLCGQSQLEVMDQLSLMEIRVNDSQAHKAIALCKQTITGKRKDNAFVQQCWKLQGLI